MKGDGGWVMSVAFSPDEYHILSGNENGTLHTWDTRRRRAIGLPLNAHEGAVTGVAFCPNGNRIVSGGVDGMLRLWNTQTGQPSEPLLKGHEGG